MAKREIIFAAIGVFVVCAACILVMVFRPLPVWIIVPVYIFIVVVLVRTMRAAVMEWRRRRDGTL
jgi:hypothetical protein